MSVVSGDPIKLNQCQPILTNTHPFNTTQLPRRRCFDQNSQPQLSAAVHNTEHHPSPSLSTTTNPYPYAFFFPRLHSDADDKAAAMSKLQPLAKAALAPPPSDQPLNYTTTQDYIYEHTYKHISYLHIRTDLVRTLVFFFCFPPIQSTRMQFI